MTQKVHLFSRQSTRYFRCNY